MSNKMAPDLGKLDELAKVHALSYASPHHFTMSVNGLREVIAELQLPAGNKMALDALTAYQAAGIGNSTDFAKQAETLVHVEDDIRAFADATCAMRASSGAAQAVRMLTQEELEHCRLWYDGALNQQLGVLRKFCEVNAGRTIPADGKIGGV